MVGLDAKAAEQGFDFATTRDRDGVPGVLIAEPTLPEGASPEDSAAELRSVWVPTDRVVVVARRQDVP